MRPKISLLATALVSLLALVAPLAVIAAAADNVSGGALKKIGRASCRERVLVQV